MNRLTMWNQPRLALGLLGGAALLLGLGLMGTRSQAADPKPAAAAKPALTVSTVQATVRSIPTVLSANGNVLAWQEASVGAELGGMRVQALHANVGDVVRSGQLLATLASEGVEADVALARAQLAEAQANSADAVGNAERARALQATGALSAQQIAQLLTTEQTAAARLESAKAALQAQLLRLKYTQVLAPDSGTITARSTSLGAVVGAGTEMFRMIRQGRLEWRAELTSAELARVPVGTSVVVLAPGGAQAQGRVRMVAPTVNAQTRDALVYVDLPAGSAARAGMFARGEFMLGQQRSQTLPQSAVLLRGGLSYVMRLDADNKVKVHEVKVSVGRRLGDRIEITGGLDASARVAANGLAFLGDGDTVRVITEPPVATPGQSVNAQPAR